MKPEREPYVRIVVGILTLAILPPVAIAYFGPDSWFTDLKEWQTGLGAYWGALFGLGAILIGALFNADLNRRRDKRLREQEARALAAALYGEARSAHAKCEAFLNGAEHTVVLARHRIDEGKVDPLEVRRIDFDLLPHISMPVYEANCHQIGILGPTIATEVAGNFSQMLEYKRAAEFYTHMAFGDIERFVVTNAEQVRKNLLYFVGTISILYAYANDGENVAMKLGSMITADREKQIRNAQFDGDARGEATTDSITPETLSKDDHAD